MSRPGAKKEGASAKKAHVDVRMTASQKLAIERAARRVGLDPSTWMRMVSLKETDWEPDDDPEFPQK